MATKHYTIPDFGPSDLLTSDVIGERRVKVEVDVETVTLNNVNIDNFPAEYPLPAAQVQTNALTDAELRASAVPVSGDWLTEAQYVANTQINGLTDAQLRASPVPVSAASLPLPSGAATAAKQLPDNHQVTVSNQISQPLTLAQFLTAAPSAHVGTATDLAIGLGLVTGIQNLSITGSVSNGISAAPTDVWAGADGALLPVPQPIWIAPTAARRHTLSSSSASDTAGGTGMRTVAVRGLTSWSTKEVTEIVTLNGLTGVLTANSYVIVNDMTMVTCGSAGPNVGRVTAVAQTDNTISLAMRPNSGRTTTTIYGIPSVQRLVFRRWDVFLNRESAASFIEARFLVNLNPAAQPSGWIEADRRTATSSGSSAPQWLIDPPPAVNGPAILKVQVEGSKASTSGGASYGFYLVDI